MKLTSFIFIIFVSVLNCSEQKPRGWKDLISFSNPLATFQPSIISSGHAQYFGSIDELSYQQKHDLEKFLTYLGMVKIFEIAVAGWFVYAQQPRSLFGSSLAFSVLNAYYLFELKMFKGKLDRAIKNENV